ncbi:eukaryotic membrane protein family-domain-containing protein [Radiomyces spectabilis]|uniref:eukaryotic membrane protein family-domain-containing protein n=1 Tax=Radiomyces spectabilis TaxID=64574 RepID=UPI002220E9E5|nr:eukaryotic membrane protein family-domain-containing protein [Radiomyces spectabilis]KAI8384826.1 eukaryotic membrane protein family-domain-containing protein [Radiomyces spectabilis]
MHQQHLHSRQRVRMQSADGYVANSKTARTSSLPAESRRPSYSSPTSNSFQVLDDTPPSSPSIPSSQKKKKKKKSPTVVLSTSPQLVPTGDHASPVDADNQVPTDLHHSNKVYPASCPTSPLATADGYSGARKESNHTNNYDTHSGKLSISFWDYLRDELTVSDFDSAQELKRERVTNFLAVPGAVEKLMVFGFVVCLDSFLYTFTILPLRFCLALYNYSRYIVDNTKVFFTRQGRYARLRPSQKCDLLKGFLIMITCLAMWSLDPSRLYHSIRGQAVLKLYVVFNVLEICDKLCCSVGVDILDALFSKSTLGNAEQGTGTTTYARRHLRPFTLFLLATGYMVIHTTVLFFQMITMNVAINFYSNALLSLLISNQFVEIKQAVFKKFEKENLFQLSCSDIVERYQQFAFLVIITLRNVVELSDSSPSSILPSTFVPLFKLPATTSFNALMTPVVMVIASELMVDWVKHAFITKFNQIRPSIYGKYVDLLCKDLVVGSPGRLSGQRNAFIDQSPVVSRRIGFPVLPLACLHVRMMQQLLPMIFMSYGGGGQTTHQASPTSSMMTQSLLRYLMDHQAFVSRMLPARIHLIVLSMVKCGWIESVVDRGLRLLTWILLVTVLALILLALKVLVGTTLLGFAYKRYASMEARDDIEKEKDKAMKEMGKEEEAYHKGLKHYLDDPSDNILGKMPVKYTLENVDRFSMVRSRIP